MEKEKKKEFLRTVKFTLFSISAGIVQIVTYTLFFELLHWAEWVSYLISLILSVIWNFTFNRRYTFKSANNVPKAMFLTAVFYAVFTPLSTLLEKYLVGIGWNGYLVTGINMILNFVLEFLFDRFVVFKGSIDTNDIAKREFKEDLAKDTKC